MRTHVGGTDGGKARVLKVPRRPTRERRADAVAYSPDGTFIASGGFDRTVQVWNATTGARTVTYQGHTNSVNALAWSPDGASIASGSMDTTVQVWQAI